MSYQVKRKGRTICKIKPNAMNVKLLIYLIDVLGYSLHGTYSGCKEQLKNNRLEN
jgi:hypothetical protein